MTDMPAFPEEADPEPAAKGGYHFAVMGAASALLGGWWLARLAPPTSVGEIPSKATGFASPMAAKPSHPSATAPAAAQRPGPLDLIGGSRDLFIMAGPYRGLENPSTAPEGEAGVPLGKGQWDPPADSERAGDPADETALWDFPPSLESPRLSRGAAGLRRALADAQRLSNEGAGTEAKRADLLSSAGEACKAAGCRAEGASELESGAFDGVLERRGLSSSAAPVAISGRERPMGQADDAPDAAAAVSAAQKEKARCEEARAAYGPLIAQALARLQGASADGERRAACLELADLRCLSRRECPLTAGIPCAVPDCGA
jgi:hypothetical protein